MTDSTGPEPAARPETTKTDSTGPEPGARHEITHFYLRAAWAVLRVLASIAVLVAVYYLLPSFQHAAWAEIAVLVIGLVLLIGLIGFQVHAIAQSRFPDVRAIEALATTIPLFVLLFARTYFVMEQLSASSFSTPLTRTDALYFTVTVFSTVGFGDITAKSEVARLVVTSQMFVDLLILGLGIRILTGAITRGRQRQRQGHDAPDAQPTE